MNLLRLITILGLLIVSSKSFAFTIGIGGNIENTLVKTDHITTDMCSYLYDCDRIRHVSLEGKAGLIESGNFSDDNLKSRYAATAINSEYAEFTEKSGWADTNKDDSTELNAAFTSKWVNDPFVDNADYASKALGAEYAPSSKESLVVTDFADTVINMERTDFYSTSKSAGLAVITNNAAIYTGSDPLYETEVAIRWERAPIQYIEY
ncbi:MAG: hypothetical protein IBX72_15305 [Nitrospirae bacterium]|jgi:hypothetical protein|nr:hypothetical protein [Nitrospirota bacterium]